MIGTSSYQPGKEGIEENVFSAFKMEFQVAAQKSIRNSNFLNDFLSYRVIRLVVSYISKNVSFTNKVRLIPEKREKYFEN